MSSGSTGADGHLRGGARGRNRKTAPLHHHPPAHHHVVLQVRDTVNQDFILAAIPTLSAISTLIGLCSVSILGADYDQFALRGLSICDADAKMHNRANGAALVIKSIVLRRRGLPIKTSGPPSRKPYDLRPGTS